MSGHPKAQPSWHIKLTITLATGFDRWDELKDLEMGGSSWINRMGLM